MTVESLLTRLASYVDKPSEAAFGPLALEVYSLQCASIPAIARLAESSGARPESIDDWRQIPLVPTLAFKSQSLHVQEPLETFRSSGTRGVGRSTHYHPFPDLYRTLIDRSFPRECLSGLVEPSMLSLVPRRTDQPDSSLSFMVEHVVKQFGSDDSDYAIGPRGIKLPIARSWLGARQREGAPCLVLATSLALDQLLDALEKRYLHFRLPPGSVLFETGGLKGREREVSRDRLQARTTEYLGLGPEAIVWEYGMTELSSQAYASQRSQWRYRLPSWVRVRALHPETLVDQPAGASGLLAFLDLGNLGSAIHVLTEDVGRVAEDGSFWLEGRATDAELRGCSLTVEELALT